MFTKIYEKIKKFFKENYLYFIVLACLIFLFYYEFPYVIYKSGGVIDLKDRIEVKTDNPESGSLSMSYVTAMKGTIPFILLSYVLPDWDLFPIKEVTVADSYDESIERGKEYMQEGIDNAIIAAFRASNTPIEITKATNEIIYISEDADTNLEVGEKILKIDGKELYFLKDLKDYVNSLKAGDTVTIEVESGDKIKERKAIVYLDKDDTLKIGVAFTSDYQYKTSIPVDIKVKNNESGSSGSLMMALSLYNALTEEDITKGKNIVGTGVVEADGTVEEIGGIKYKLLGASKKKADIFLCPEANYEEAKQVVKDKKLKMKLVSINSLEEAIDYLNNM